MAAVRMRHLKRWLGLRSLISLRYHLPGWRRYLMTLSWKRKLWRIRRMPSLPKRRLKRKLMRMYQNSWGLST